LGYTDIYGNYFHTGIDLQHKRVIMVFRGLKRYDNVIPGVLEDHWRIPFDGMGSNAISLPLKTFKLWQVDL